MSAPVASGIRYGDELIRFALRARDSRAARRIVIHVEHDGRVLVDAPADATEAVVRGAVRQRAAWISRQLAGVRQRLLRALPREHVSGEALLYLGRRYQLKVVDDASRQGTARMRGAHIEVAAADATHVRAALDAWYLARAREFLTGRLEAVAASLAWVRTPPPMRLRTMRRRWGSCSPDGRVTLNPQLVKAPRECIDYVIVHELCHLLAHDHGPRFYRALDKQMPGWRATKLRLDAMAEQILGAA